MWATLAHQKQHHQGPWKNDKSVRDLSPMETLDTNIVEGKFWSPQRQIILMLFSLPTHQRRHGQDKGHGQIATGSLNGPICAPGNCLLWGLDLALRLKRWSLLTLPLLLASPTWQGAEAGSGLEHQGSCVPVFFLPSEKALGLACWRDGQDTGVGPSHPINSQWTHQCSRRPPWEQSHLR